MFVVNGGTGQVGGAVATALLAAGLPVRVIVRDSAKADRWRALGSDVAVVADAADAGATTSAFAGAQAVFLINPPNYDPEPGFPDTHAAAAAATAALRRARPGHTVFLSSIGAHVSRFNLLNNAGIFEAVLREAGVPIAMLRPAWFMENAAADLAAARTGRIESYLQPLDHPIAMVSVRDIGRVAAEMLQDVSTVGRIVELAGPARYSANDVAASFAAVLGHSVTATAIPRASWETLFRGQGMHRPEARRAMLDGFNADWLDFEGGEAERRVGVTSLDSALQAVVMRESVN